MTDGEPVGQLVVVLGLGARLFGAKHDALIEVHAQTHPAPKLRRGMIG